MAAIKVSTNFNIDLDFEIPEFHKRMFAWVIDMVIQTLYLILAIRLYIEYLTQNLTEANIEDAGWVFRIILWPVIIYHIICEITMNGQSLGKKIFRIKVVNENGGRASISQFLIRCLIRTSDIILLLIIIESLSGNSPVGGVILSIVLLMVDIILVATTKKAQRLGDILAHTILIRTNPKGSISQTVFQEVDDSYVPKFPQIMQLNDKDLNAIKSILDTARMKHDFHLAATAAEKIKKHLGITTNMDPVDFLEVLLKDYNYLSVK